MVMRAKRVFCGGESWTLVAKMVKITLIDEIDLDFLLVSRSRNN